MASSPPPSGDLELESWALNYSALITATPTVYGLVAGDATALAALVSDYSTRLAAARNPNTRTAGTIAAKDTSKLALRNKARQLARIIQAHPSVTNQQRADLGLTVRDAEPTPFPPPVTRPVITFEAIGPLQSALRIVDELTPTSRARPRGTIGCELWVKVGGTPPAGIDDCRYQQLATRNRTVVTFPAGSGNQTCYVLARWVNPRGEAGPVSNVASATIAA